MKALSTLAFAAATGTVVHANSLVREALEQSRNNRRALIDRQSNVNLEKRQVSTDGRCGTDFGTVCSSTECCSSAG